MSATLLETVWRTSRATGSAKMVLLAIANAAGDNDASAELSVPEIAEAAEIKERQARLHLRALEGLGELGTTIAHGRGHRSCYTICLPTEKGQSTTPFPPADHENRQYTAPIIPAASEKRHPTAPIPSEKGQRTTGLPAQKGQSSAPFRERGQPTAGFPATNDTPPVPSTPDNATEKRQSTAPFAPTGDNTLSDTPPEISSPAERSPEKRQRSSSQAPRLAEFAPDSTPMLLAVRLRDRILTTLPDAKVPKTPQQMQPWARTFDLMIRVDHRGHDNISACIDYAHAEPFWQAHVLSADSLRKHYQTLEVQRHARQRTHGAYQPRRASGAASRPPVATADYWAEEARRQAKRQAQHPALPGAPPPLLARAAV